MTQLAIHSPALPTTTAADNDDALLLAGMLRDDARAWREFNQRYSRLMHSCIAKVMNRFRSVCSQDDIDEVYSTLCLQLLARDKHRLRSFDVSRGNKLGSWLGMLATHAAYDLLRSRRRVPPTDQLENIAAVIPLYQSGADDVCEARQQAAQLATILRDFSDKDQEFFALYFGEGLEPEEVAERMSISVKTVYSKKHKLRARLESALAAAALAA